MGWTAVLAKTRNREILMIKVHDGCYIAIQNITAIWSEIHADPKLDSSCYLVRILFTNNPTILTIASYDSKIEADKLVKRIATYEKNI